jgi:hypothetical protein
MRNHQKRKMKSEKNDLDNLYVWKNKDKKIIISDFFW